MKEIPLTQGKVALVDDADYERLSKFKWCYNDGYAVCKPRRGQKIYMHREIMQTPKGMEVDHANSCGLDNRRENMRNCTRSQNQANRGCQSNNKYGYKGVSFSNREKKFRAMIQIGGRKIHVGYFYTAKEAAMAYNDAAKNVHGEFAKLNTISEEAWT